jgi:hypothetical protein
MRRALFATIVLILSHASFARSQGIITIGMMAMSMGKSDSTMTIAAARSPSECSMAISNEYGRMYRDMRDTTKRMKQEDIDRKGVELSRACAKKFATATLSLSELVELSELYSRANMREEAIKAAARGRSVAKSGEDSAIALEAVVSAASRGPKAPEDALSTAETFAAQLSSMSPKYARYKVSAHMTLAGAVSDTSSAIEHAEGAIKAAREAPKEVRESRDSLRSFGRASLIDPYLSLAEFQAKRGLRQRAEELLAEAQKDLPGAKDMLAWRSKSVAQYFLLGQPAPEMAATNWLNAPAGTRKLTLTGVVTVIEATAHW